MHAWHLLMDQWVRFGDREPSDGAPLAELWRVFPPQPSELALPAARRRGFVHPRSRFLISGPRNFVLKKPRGSLRLVDISRTPSGTFFF